MRKMDDDKITNRKSEATPKIEGKLELPKMKKNKSVADQIKQFNKVTEQYTDKLSEAD